MGGSKFSPVDPNWSYKIQFDASLGLEEVWVDSQTLDYLNSFRENIHSSQSFSVPQSSLSIPIPAHTHQAATRMQPKRQNKLELNNESVETKSTAPSNNESASRHQSSEKYGLCH